jgi:hypothetical protein
LTSNGYFRHGPHRFRMGVREGCIGTASRPICNEHALPNGAIIPSTEESTRQRYDVWGQSEPNDGRRNCAPKIVYPLARERLTVLLAARQELFIRQAIRNVQGTGVARSRASTNASAPGWAPPHPVFATFESCQRAQHLLALIPVWTAVDPVLDGVAIAQACSAIPAARAGSASTRPTTSRPRARS